jgi:predicted Zn-dependent protease
MALNTLKIDSLDISSARRKALEEGLEIRQSMDLDRIARQHEVLFTQLERLIPGGWRVSYRAETNRRLHLPPGMAPVISRFDYLSLLITLYPDRGGQALEIGEGGVRPGQINIDGLCRRVEDLLENQRRRRVVNFKGPVDLVLAAGDGAILFHEMAGHALEADHIAQRRSPLWTARIGDPVAAPVLSLSSGDPRDAFYGETICDDEGEPHGPTELIREGRLAALMGDNFHAAEIEGCVRGFSRSSDYTQVPQPRMFGMFVQSGTMRPEELMAGVRRGIYASEFGPGSAILERDRFQFRILAADLIEDGRITAPLGTVDVFGPIRETLMGIRGVADDFSFDRGVSYCVKNRQTLHVRVGQPTVLIGGVGVRPLAVS